MVAVAGNDGSTIRRASHAQALRATFLVLVLSAGGRTIGTIVEFLVLQALMFTMTLLLIYYLLRLGASRDQHRRRLTKSATEITFSSGATPLVLWAALDYYI